MNSQLLTTKEAALVLGVSPAFLERDRWAGAKVPFVRLGSRSIRYRREDLNAYIEASVHTSTSEYSEEKSVAQA